MQTFVTSKSRENILSKIRKGLSDTKLPIPFPEAEREGTEVFNNDRSAVEEVFAESFINLGGKFVFCDSATELLQNLSDLRDAKGWDYVLCSNNSLLRYAEARGVDFVLTADPFTESALACITGCEMLVARTGSVLLTSNQNIGRTATVFYPTHIIVAYIDQIVPDIEDAFDILKKKYGNDLPSMINLNTGPSRTADIEKTLVVGVHGPGEVYCFVIASLDDAISL